MTDALEYLSQEGVDFCLYCGGTLAPSRSKFGKCIDCDTEWERCYSTDCPACGGGWVHLPHPDHVEEEEGRHIFAEGYGWCDGCDAYVYYMWSDHRDHDFCLFLLSVKDKFRADAPEELVWAS